MSGIDAVSKPSHYIVAGWEAKDIIQDVVQHYRPVEAWAVGNVLKYVIRAPHKGALLQDLRKAREYLTMAIDHLER